MSGGRMTTALIRETAAEGQDEAVYRGPLG